MSQLESIWWVSIGLSFLSLFFIFQLVVVRIFRERHEKIRGARRAELSKLVFRALNEDDDRNLVMLPKRDLDILGEILLELLRSLEGADADRLRVLMRRNYPIGFHLHDLKSKNIRRRLSAISFLTYYDSYDSDAALMEAVCNGAWAVRIAAARALLTTGREVDVKRLVSGLMASPDVRTSAMRGIFGMIGATHTSELIEILRETKSDEITMLAITGLGESGDYDAILSILSYATHPVANVRAVVMRSIGEFQHPDGAAAVLNGLSDPAWQVRTQAATAAGRIGVIEAVAPLVRLVSDDHWWVRFRASEALSALGDAGIEALNDIVASSPSGANIAKMALQERGLV